MPRARSHGLPETHSLPSSYSVTSTRPGSSALPSYIPGRVERLRDGVRFMGRRSGLFEYELSAGFIVVVPPHVDPFFRR